MPHSLSGVLIASILDLILCSMGLRITQLSLELKARVDADCLTKTLELMPQKMDRFFLVSHGLF